MSSVTPKSFRVKDSMYNTVVGEDVDRMEFKEVFGVKGIETLKGSNVAFYPMTSIEHFKYDSDDSVVDVEV